MINKAILLGNLGKDPEMRTTQGGKEFCLLAVATSKKVKQGENWVDKTVWHNVTLWSAVSANYAGKYAKKGTKVYLEGETDHRKYTDANGVEKWATNINVNAYGGEFKIVSGGVSDQGQGGNNPPAPKPDEGMNNPADLDDEIPF